MHENIEMRRRLFWIVKEISKRKQTSEGMRIIQNLNLVGDFTLLEEYFLHYPEEIEEIFSYVVHGLEKLIDHYHELEIKLFDEQLANNELRKNIG